jgi:hypothetical protein
MSISVLNNFLCRLYSDDKVVLNVQFSGSKFLRHGITLYFSHMPCIFWHGKKFNLSSCQCPVKEHVVLHHDIMYSMLLINIILENWESLFVPGISSLIK